MKLFREKRLHIKILVPIIVILSLFLVYQAFPKSNQNRVNPSLFENAIVAYDVTGSAPRAPLDGELYFKVINITDNEYTLSRTLSGNLYRILENNKTITHNENDLLMCSVAKKRGLLVGKSKIDTEGRTINLLHYKFENTSGKGLENVEVWVPEKISVPILARIVFSSGKISMVIDETNIPYLVVKSKP